VYSIVTLSITPRPISSERAVKRTQHCANLAKGLKNESEQRHFVGLFASSFSPHPSAFKCKSIPCPGASQQFSTSKSISWPV
jgi:hypothetical protein